jgi:hypothetical protein
MAQMLIGLPVADSLLPVKTAHVINKILVIWQMRNKKGRGG